MHAFFHTPAAERRSFWVRRAPTPAEAPVAAAPPVATSASAPACLMQMTIDSGSITVLRQMVMRICGDAMEFMRIEACDHGTRMKVWICTSTATVAQVMEAVMRNLPGAEFGRFAERAPQRGGQ